MVVWSMTKLSPVLVIVTGHSNRVKCCAILDGTQQCHCCCGALMCVCVCVDCRQPVHGVGRQDSACV